MQVGVLLAQKPGPSQMEDDDDVDLALNEELRNKQKDDWHILHVDTYQLKGRQLECGKIYEFLGEIEQVSEMTLIFIVI